MVCAKTFYSSFDPPNPCTELRTDLHSIRLISEYLFLLLCLLRSSRGLLGLVLGPILGLVLGLVLLLLSLREVVEKLNINAIRVARLVIP